MTVFNLHGVVLLATVLFAIGVYGVLARRQVIVMLMAIEIMMAAGALLLCGFSRYHLDADGQVLLLFVMAVAAAEAAVGLAILVAFHRRFQTIDADRARSLRG